jgi:hypothetical protein
VFEKKRGGGVSSRGRRRPQTWQSITTKNEEGRKLVAAQRSFGKIVTENISLYFTKKKKIPTYRS